MELWKKSLHEYSSTWSECLAKCFTLNILFPAPAIQSLNEALVEATIRVYSTITSQLLPTPAKSHYTFNLRDLSKVFQGIRMANADTIEVVKKKKKPYKIVDVTLVLMEMLWWLVLG